MKWLIILGLLLLVGILLAVRYRRQIQMVLYVFKMFRQMRQMGRSDAQEKQIKPSSVATDIPLVRCARCGSWKPQSKAFKFGGNVFYCSSNCLEKAVHS